MGKTKKAEPVEITVIGMTAEMQKAYDGSYYTILGAGGDLQEWVRGYGDMMEEALIERPTSWFQTDGQAINDFAGRRGEIADRDAFQPDLTVLMFPLDGLHVGRLAMFKLQMQDRWFDDVVDNMVRA